MNVDQILQDLEKHFQIQAKQVANLINEPFESLLTKKSKNVEQLKDPGSKRLVTLHQALHTIRKQNPDPYLCRLALLQICRATPQSPAQSFINALCTTANPGEKLILLAQAGMNIQISKPRK